MGSTEFDEWAGGDTALADSLVEFHSIVDEEFSATRLEATFLTPAQILAQVALLDPGPDAIRLLDLLDGVALTSGQALALAGEWERLGRWVTARQHQAMVSFAGKVKPPAARDDDRAESSNVLELGLTLDVGPDLTRDRLAQARLLSTTLAATGRALEFGEVSGYRARRICEALAGLQPEVARQIEAKVLPSAGTVSLRTLSRRLRTAVLKAQG